MPLNNSSQNSNSPTCEMCPNQKLCLSGQIPCKLYGTFLTGENQGLTPQEVEYFKEIETRFYNKYRV